MLREGKEDGVFALPISEIILLMKTFIDNNANLFDKNIRSFLKNAKLSKQMESTLKNEPSKFHLYHNGITLVAKEKIVGSGNCYSVKNPQIVNGAQTVNSLFLFYSQNPSSKIFSKAKILCKIVTAKDDFFEKKICETSNTQIPIKLSDLRTNDNEQLKIKKYIESINGSKFVYLLKRKTPIPEGYVGVSFEELMQWACAAILERPGYAKNNKKDIFDILLVDDTGESVYKKIVNSLLSEPNLINRICVVGVFVKNEISLLDADEIGLHKDMSIYIITSLMHMKSVNLKRDYKNVYFILKKYSDGELKKNPRLNTGKIFKSDTPWVEIKKELDKIKK